MIDGCRSLLLMVIVTGLFKLILIEWIVEWMKDCNAIDFHHRFTSMGTTSRRCTLRFLLDSFRQSSVAKARNTTPTHGPPPCWSARRASRSSKKHPSRNKSKNSIRRNIRRRTSIRDKPTLPRAAQRATASTVLTVPQRKRRNRRVLSRRKASAWAPRVTCPRRTPRPPRPRPTRP